MTEGRGGCTGNFFEGELTSVHSNHSLSPSATSQLKRKMYVRVGSHEQGVSNLCPAVAHLRYVEASPCHRPVAVSEASPPARQSRPLP